MAPYRIIRLRRRYILTRSNVPRLRYVSAASVFLLMLGIAHMLPAAPDAAIDAEQLASVEPTSGEAEEAPISTASYIGRSMNEIVQGHISEGMRRAALAIKKAEPSKNRQLEIGSGDTVAGVLQSAGVSSKDSFGAVEALKKYYDPRQIKPGQIIHVNFRPSADGLEFDNMSMKLDAVKEVTVSKGAEDFSSAVKEKKLVQHTRAAGAKIQTSLYGSAARAGIPSQVIAEVIRAYSWDVDFQRDIREGDKIEIMYETYETEDGDFSHYGNVLYASLSVSGKDIPIYRYETKDGRVDYFEPDGHSIRKTLMRTPIDGARISSGFGMRHHPILGYTKMHKGIDFAAPTGTPIYAAGDGTVDFAGRMNGYGNFIRLRHNSSLKTAYGHMHRLAKGISKGKRVHQGDVIGYVGATGRATGPHLHYEVMVKGTQVNPNSVDLPTGEQLEGGELKRFKSQMAKLGQQYVALNEGLKYAQGGNGGKFSNRM